MNKKLIGAIAPFTLVLAGFIATSILAETKKNRDGKGFEKMASALNLTKEQQDKARSLREKREPLEKAQREKIQPLRKELREILSADKVDVNAARQKMTALSALKIEQKIQRIQNREEFKAILTTEQRTKLLQMHKERGEKRDHKHKAEKQQK